jgi:hypothetical protein
MSLYIYIGKLFHGRASGHSAELSSNYGLISAVLALLLKSFVRGLAEVRKATISFVMPVRL